MSDFIVIFICLCIVFLEVLAIFNGIDGTCLMAAIGALSTIGGWQAKKAHMIRQARRKIK
jgi:hypothetical protein